MGWKFWAQKALGKKKKKKMVKGVTGKSMVPNRSHGPLAQ